MTPAATCRANGWTVGTHLAGDEGSGETVIRITAIGESAVLAIASSRDGGWVALEGSWTFDHRDWRVVEPTP